MTFWEKMDKLTELKEAVPASAREAMESQLPEPLRTTGWRAGGPESAAWAISGSCPRRLVRRGGRAGSQGPGAVGLPLGQRREQRPDRDLYQAIVTEARRACDPFVQLRGHWIVRRLAPDCSRIELASLPTERDEARLLHAMGWETANIHLGSRDTVGAVRRDLERRPRTGSNRRRRRWSRPRARTGRSGIVDSIFRVDGARLLNNG